VHTVEDHAPAVGVGTRRPACPSGAVGRGALRADDVVLAVEQDVATHTMTTTAKRIRRARAGRTGLGFRDPLLFRHAALVAVVDECCQSARTLWAPIADPIRLAAAPQWRVAN